MLTAKHKLEFKTGKRTAKTIVQEGNHADQQPPGRLPRITKMMALAIRLDHLIRTGQVTDQAELARLGSVSRARLTQIMTMLQLAPDIQEHLLFLPKSDRHNKITEREIRLLARCLDWNTQRKNWEAFARGKGSITAVVN